MNPIQNIRERWRLENQGMHFIIELTNKQFSDPPFNQNSAICPDHPQCRFLFEGWMILSSVTERMHSAFQFLVAS